MFRELSKKRLILVFILFIILSGVLFLPVVYSLSDKLSETDRVNANILLVEGWVPPYALRMAFNEFKKTDMIALLPQD